MWLAVIVNGLTFVNAVVCVPCEGRNVLERRLREKRVPGARLPWDAN